MTSIPPSSVLLLSMGILLGSFPLDVLAAGIGTTSSKLNIPRIGINRSSKDNGGSLSYTRAEYATHRPYKVDFDLLQASDRSHELEMPLLRNNDIMDENDSDFFLTLDPTLRSRRRRRRQVESQQVISATSPDFQRFNLCLPYFNTNPMCRQIFFGLTNTNNPATIHSNFVQNHAHGHAHHPSALAVPSSASPSTTAFYVPSAFPPSSSISSISSNKAPVVAAGPMNRNDLAILNYYQQQQFPPQQQQQAHFQHLGVFQGPIPVQRQRPEYDNIHQKFPYPYPPTDIQQPVQAIVPESVSATVENAEGGNSGVSTDIPSDISQTTLLPEVPAGVDQQQGAGQQDPSSGHFPDSPIVQEQQQQQQQPQEPAVVVDSIQTTTYNPEAMTSSSPLPPSSSSQPDLSTPPSTQEQYPPAAPQGDPAPGVVPVSPDQLNTFPQQAPPAPVQVSQPVPPQPPQPDPAMLKKLREQEEAIRSLKTQLEQANLQVVSYEQENGMIKDQFMRSEEANIKLRDRVLQLENTNQHLQEQNGQLQQVTAEQRQQINGLKVSVKEVTDQLDSYQNQVNPLAEEVQKHRKEIEDFLIRIRKLGEENETCKKQVRLYQLKVNYIMDQQRQQQQQQQQPQQRPQLKKKQPPSSSSQHPSSPKQPSAADLTVHDDELDPELSRMDAEIAALQKNADEVAAAIQNLPQPSIPQQQPENLSSPAAAGALPDSAIPPATSSTTLLKKETQFPGEAVQVDPQQTKHKKQQETEQKIATAADVARAESVSRTIPPGSAPTWEQPAGF